MKGNEEVESKHAWNAVMLSMNSCMASSPSSILAALRLFPWPSRMNCGVSIRWCYFTLDSVGDLVLLLAFVLIKGQENFPKKGQINQYFSPKKDCFGPFRVAKHELLYNRMKL